MAVTNGWGQGVINNTNGWGKLATNNIGAGSVYENSASGDTALIGTSAAFSYSASSFTQADADPTPTITGTTGGTFSGTTGLVFVSTSTGQIDLSASTIAAHVVTYTVGGVSSNFNLSVTAAPFASTQSFDLDGVDDFIGVSSLDTSVLPTGSFTISTWFNTSGGGFGGLVQVGDFAGNVAFNLVKGPNRNIVVQLELSGGQKLISTSNFQFNENEWNNLILVFDNSITSQSFKIYVNNVLKATSNESPSGQTIVYPANSELRLGQWNNIGTTNNYFFEGNIDETAIFNTALSSSDVETIYGTGVPNDISSLNPVAWYRMGENSNYKSPQWLMPENSNFANSRYSNYSFEFDGMSDEIDLPDIPFLRGGGQHFSISVWVLTTHSSQAGFFAARVAPSSTNLIRLFRNTNRQAVLEIKSSSTGDIQIRSSTNSLTTNNWHHIVATFDGTKTAAADRSNIYIDGVLDNSLQTGTGTNLPSGTSGIFNFIGRTFLGLRQTGKINNLAIFNTTLSSSDVDAIFGTGFPSDISSLSPVAHYRLGEEATFSSNWTIPDQVGSNDGTSSNMTIEDRVGDSPNSTNNAVSFNMVEADRETDVPS